MPTVRIAIHGAAGRMGRRLIALASADPELAVAAALESADHPRLGEDAGAIAGAGPIGTPLAASLEVDVDALVDFSLPGAVEAVAGTCAERGVPLGRR